MAGLQEYLTWRGDLTFAQDPPSAVDALMFSALSYLHFGGELLSGSDRPVLLRDAAADFFELPDIEDRIRSKDDPDLLDAAASSVRFGLTKLSYYRDVLIPEEDTQFAAVTFFLDDGSAVLAFRGTDYSVTGWKEDFNMSFQETVPAQRLALRYLEKLGDKFSGPLRICGHSKGGNLAVYSASKCSAEIQDRILAIYNNDGPGFAESMMADAGYQRIVPRIHTYVPQSSVIGMLLDHAEPYTIVKSKRIGLLQHDIFTWELEGPRFVPMEEITADSRFLNQTIRNWIAELDPQERNQLVDAVFGILSVGNVESAPEIFQPKNIRNYLKTIGENEGIRRVLSGEFVNLMEAVRKTYIQLSDQREEQENREKQQREPVLIRLHK